MTEQLACLHDGEVRISRRGKPAERLESPYREQLANGRAGQVDARIVSVTRGRTSAELCYAVDSRDACAVFAQVPGSGQEQRLFHGLDTHLSELDFGSADAALACTVAGADGTSAIAVLSDDGKGLRTVTEGDVIDRAPRWVPGGRGEIVYVSAGIGRTKAGKAVGRSSFALHRLRFSDNSVEVLMADAQYDYRAVIPISENLFYALRRSYEQPRPASPLGQISGTLRGLFAGGANTRARTLHTHELIRITAKGSQLVATDVLAFDVTASEDIVYSTQSGVFGISARNPTPEPILALERVEQLLIYR